MHTKNRGKLKKLETRKVSARHLWAALGDTLLAQHGDYEAKKRVRGRRRIAEKLPPSS